MLLWLSLALAAPPDKTATLIDVTGGSGTDRLRNLSISYDGRLVVGKSGASNLGFVLDVEQWEIVTIDDCEVQGIAVDSYGDDIDDQTYEVWLGCSDGTVRGKYYDDGTLSDITDDDGVAASIEVETAGFNGLYLEYVNDSPYVFTITAESGVGSTAHVFDPLTFGFDGSSGLWSGPVTLATDGFKDATVSPLSSTLVVAHGNSDQSYLNLASGTWTLVPRTQGLQLNCDDLAPSRVGDWVFCVQDSGTLGQVSRLIPSTGSTTLLSLGTLNDPQGIVVSDEVDSSWMAVTGGQVKVWELDDSENPVDVDNPVFTGVENADNQIQDIVTRDGYLFGGGVAGNLHIVTANPWMYVGTSSAEVVGGGVASTGSEVEVTFSWDEEVEWTLFRGGNRFEAGDTLTTSDEPLPEETPTTVTVVVDDSWVEGKNSLFVWGESTDDGLVGYGHVSVEVDNPPKPPTLRNSNVSFGNQRLTLAFDGIEDADLDYYQVWVSTEPFDGDDYETGGPSYDGGTRLSTPITVQAAPEEAVDLDISPLQNDVTYYMAVRAYDTGGKEGPMSAVVSGVPKETFGAADLAGAPGGSPCSTAPSSAAGGLALLALGAVARRRRWAAAATLATVGLLLPSVGLAQSSRDEDPWWKADQTPARGNFEARYGVISLTDDNLTSVYDQNPTNLLQIEAGPQFFRVFELDVGIGFFQELAFTVTDTGAKSGERSMMTWWPFALDGSFRLHILDEQPVVPFVRYGWDYVIWTEEIEVGSSRQKTRGGKFGSHYSLGANLLLDLFQPGRASMLEARSGINDSWLTFEWRRQAVDLRKQPWGTPVTQNSLSFDGDAFMVGLKLDY